MSRRTTRRDFLRGKAANDALADAVEQALPAAHEGSESETDVMHVARSAMACQFEVFLNAGQYRADMIAALESLDLVERLESQMTYFRPTSELSRINELAARQPVEIEPRLFALLELALQLNRETDGAFDITASPLWDIWGFARRACRVPSDNEIAETMDNVGSHLVKLDRDHRTVRFLRPGVRLNLGSIGKGYALDRAAEVLATAGIGDFLVHGGQSSVLARGSRMETSALVPREASQGWTVGLAHPLRRTQRLAEIHLLNESLGTSSSAIQSFRHQGRSFGHILDPRTGRPADGLLSVTVLAPTATLADALATAFFVMGEEPSRDYCREHPEIAAIFIVPRSRGAGIEIRSTGLPEQRLQLKPH